MSVRYKRCKFEKEIVERDLQAARELLSKTQEQLIRTQEMLCLAWDRIDELCDARSVIPMCAYVRLMSVSGL
jgi:hypothetical protein